MIPHDSKLYKGGEDSADSSDTILTISDGVGGWAKSGVDPGLFSKELTRSVIEFSEVDEAKGAHQLLVDACYNAGDQFRGSATAVILKLFDDSTIEAANLGDSGYALFHVL